MHHRNRPTIYLIMFFQLSCSPPKVHLTHQKDSDIVIVNIGTADRASIARMIRTADSCHPAVIGVCAWFAEPKNTFQDSLLEDALINSSHVVLMAGMDNDSKVIHTMERFRKHASAEGPAINFQHFRLEDSFSPVPLIGGESYEHFALQILQTWKPGIQLNIKPGKKIPVNFTRTLDQYIVVDADYFWVKNCDFKDRVILLAYIGPGEEDKHFTPLRFTGQYKDSEPDTYGAVIIANEVRTLMEQE